MAQSEEEKSIATVSLDKAILHVANGLSEVTDSITKFKEELVREREREAREREKEEKRRQEQEVERQKKEQNQDNMNNNLENKVKSLKDQLSIILEAMKTNQKEVERKYIPSKQNVLQNDDDSSLTKTVTETEKNSQTYDNNESITAPMSHNESTEFQ